MEPGAHGGPRQGRLPREDRTGHPYLAFELDLHVPRIRSDSSCNCYAEEAPL